MKKMLGLVVLVMMLFACENKVSETSSSASDSLAFPMEVTYKGAPSIGNMKNVQTVMEWNKRLSALNMDLGDLLADTVTWHLSDGTEMTASRDSTIAVLKGFVSSINSLKLTYTAAIPVDNAALNDEWVLSWTDETYSFKDGKTDHQFIHEDYRLVDGKIREVFQYARKEPGVTPVAK